MPGDGPFGRTGKASFSAANRSQWLERREGRPIFFALKQCMGTYKRGMPSTVARRSGIACTAIIVLTGYRISGHRETVATSVSSAMMAQGPLFQPISIYPLRCKKTKAGVASLARSAGEPAEAEAAYHDPLVALSGAAWPEPTWLRETGAIQRPRR